MAESTPVIIALSGRNGAGVSALATRLYAALREDYSIRLLTPAGPPAAGGGTGRGTDVDVIVVHEAGNANATVKELSGTPGLEVVLVDGLTIDTTPGHVTTLYALDAPTAAGINLGGDTGLVHADGFALTKVDLEAELARSLVTIRRDVRMVRSDRAIFLVSATTGTGISSLLGWIEDRVEGMTLE